MRSVRNKGFGIHIATTMFVTLTCDGKSVELQLQWFKTMLINDLNRWGTYSCKVRKYITGWQWTLCK